MKVLVACEFSGVVRDAFNDAGHEAWSCDLLPCEKGRWHHLQCDVREILHENFDLMIAHPPCDYLTVSSNRWFSDKAVARPGILTGAARREAQREAIAFVEMLWSAPIPRISIENPIGRLSTLWRKPEQTIQPWQFWGGQEGAGEVKATCLWLKGLPKLIATTPNETGRHPACWLESPGPRRKSNRARTYAGIAAAMAEQWGGNA